MADEVSERSVSLNKAENLASKAKIVSSNGRVLRRGHDLSRFLYVLDTRVKLGIE